MRHITRRTLFTSVEFVNSISKGSASRNTKTILDSTVRQLAVQAAKDNYWIILAHLRGLVQCETVRPAVSAKYLCRFYRKLEHSTPGNIVPAYVRRLEHSKMQAVNQMGWTAPARSAQNIKTKQKITKVTSTHLPYRKVSVQTKQMCKWSLPAPNQSWERNPKLGQLDTGRTIRDWVSEWVEVIQSGLAFALTCEKLWQVQN